MGRSTKSAWLEGPTDLREADVEDVPVAGESVRVRALSAGFSKQAQSEATEVKQVGRDQIISVNGARFEALEFAHGVIEPTFSIEEAEAISKRFGPAYNRVIAKIEELSELDGEAIKQAAERFPGSGEDEGRTDLGNGNGPGDGRPAVPARAGARAEDAGGGDV